MTPSDVPVYPRTVTCGNAEFELRRMDVGDVEAALTFAKALPPDDLLFLERDIRNPKVVAAWVNNIERGNITSILAIKDGAIHGCTAIVRDELSWSPHVGELRVVVSQSVRGTGMGGVLARDTFALAVSFGLEKLMARMTPTQRGAIAVFEEMGFSAEALLRDHVRNAAGVTQDIVILSVEVARTFARQEVFGYDEVF